MAAAAASSPFDDDAFLRFDGGGEVHVAGDADGFPASPEPYGFPPEAASFGMPDANGGVEDDPFGMLESSGDGPVLPPPGEMAPEEGFVLREWRRQNAILLEEKEKKEKELQNQIVHEAREFKQAFLEKRKLNTETSNSQNREREKLFLTNQEKFHANADKQYWKSISELIPHEIANIEKRRSKKDNEKRLNIVVIQGPKPGKPTDMSRMRQILLKLKHTSPPHMMQPLPPAAVANANGGVPAAAGGQAKPAAPGRDAPANGTVPGLEKPADAAAAPAPEPIVAA